MKTYPISITKYDHDLWLAHNLFYGEARYDLVQEVNEIRTTMHDSSRDGRVGFLPGKMYGRAMTLIAMAQDYRDAANKR